MGRPQGVINSSNTAIQNWKTFSARFSVKLKLQHILRVKVILVLQGITIFNLYKPKFCIDTFLEIAAYREKYLLKTQFEYATTFKVHVNLRVRSFGMIRIWICEPRSHGSWRMKETNECILDKDSSVPLMCCDPCDLGSQIQTHPKFLIFVYWVIC